MTEQWVTMQVAAKELNIPAYKLSRLAGQGLIKIQKDTLDRRVRLVNLTEVKALVDASRALRQEGNA